MSKHLIALKNILKVTKDAPILFESYGGKTFISSYNEYHVLCGEVASGENDYNFLLVNEVARQVARSCSDDGFTFSLKGDSVTFKSRGVSIKLPTITEESSSTKKLMSKYSTSKDILVDGESLSRVVSGVKHASNDKSIGDVVLKGYHLSASKDKIEMMASNGAVLSVATLSADTSLSQTFLLNQDFHQISQLFHGEVTVGVGSDTLSCTFLGEDGVTYRVVTGLTSGTPIAYSGVLESAEKNKYKVVLETRDFYEALKRVEFFTDEDRNSRVLVKIAADEILLSAGNHMGESQVRLQPVSSVMSDEVSLELGLPSLVSFLASVKDGEVELRFKDGLSPIYLLSETVKDVMVLFYG